MNEIKLVMRNQPQVLRFTMEPVDTSREFMKHAVEKLVKEIIANGGVRVERRYDIKRGGYWECFSVVFGNLERKLPA